MAFNTSQQTDSRNLNYISIELLAETASQLLVPTLTIEEQPVQFYRFRYESEVGKDSSRVGGLLLGRSSTDGNKSFMKVQVRGIDPACHSQLQLTVCTVGAEDMAPHPYYLHGDYCKDGFFELRKSVNTATDVWDICFDRLAVIFLTKKNNDIEKGMEARRRKVPVLEGCPDAPSAEYTSKTLRRIRLAFSLSFTDTSGRNWLLSTVFSYEIISDKEKNNIEISCLNPAEVPMEGGCQIAILTHTATTGIQKAGVKVHFASNNDAFAKNIALVLSVDEMKKYLLVLKAPDLRRMTANDRLKCAVTVHSNGFASKQLDVVFSRGLSNPNPV